jgi:cation transport ATPase
VGQRKAQECEAVKTTCMKQWIKDTAGLGTVLWLIGYLASLALFFTPLAGIMGWILLVIFTPITIAIAWWWFRPRERLSLQYYAGVGVAWMLIAVVLDYLFIVLLFQATYYGPDVFVYYAVTVLIPVGVGLYLIRIRNEPVPKQE